MQQQLIFYCGIIFVVQHFYLCCFIFSIYRNESKIIHDTAVMKAVITRLKELGVEKITGSSVYKWNEVSLKMHRRLGFTIIEETGEEYLLDLLLPL